MIEFVVILLMSLAAAGVMVWRASGRNPWIESSLPTGEAGESIELGHYDPLGHFPTPLAWNPEHASWQVLGKDVMYIPKDLIYKWRWRRRL